MGEEVHYAAKLKIPLQNDAKHHFRVTHGTIDHGD
jgi:hypothetical protein